jgi:ABC-type transport system involved in multi-copper enzyme maturation permease subunit
MTTVELDEDVVAVPPAHPGHWHLTWHGVRTVAALELRQRVRSTRWVVALVVWFVVVGGLTLLISGALSAVIGAGGGSQRGALLFAAVTFLVLGLGLLVTPTLASTSVNGDRAAGTLATLQVTLLSPAEIALGKVLAAWTASCAFLLLSVPFLAFAAAVGPTPWWSVLRVVLLVAVLLAAVCGMGLGFSALVARPAGSTVLTFVTVAALVLGTPLLFGVTYPTVEQTESVQVRVQRTDVNGNATTCELTTQQRSVAHTERTWWLLALNPFVVTADGAGTSGSLHQAETRSDPLGVLREGVRIARTGASATLDECWGVDDDGVEATADGPIWPWGLAVNLLLGAAGFVVAVRRLSLPQAKLARGTRVA